MSEKAQPWKAAWPVASADTSSAAGAETTAGTIEYGIAKGNTVVVDGTAANVKPAAPLRLQAKSQPWKASWPGAAEATTAQTAAIDYGVGKGDTVVVDGTAANVRPSIKTTASAGSTSA